MTYKEIIKDLKSRKFKPVYFLHGAESYYIDLISKYAEENILQESEKAFNQTIVYGKETEARSLIDSASRYPMMAPYQLIILKEAQDMKSLTDLQAYVEKAVPTTILMICYKHKKLDGRSSFAKSLKSNAVVFESKPLYDNQISEWVEDYIGTKKLKITPSASALISEYLGTDLSKVANELDKLAINLEKGTEVTDKIVEANIGISKDYNVFELQRAISERNVLKTTRIVKHFSANPKKNPFVVVISSLYNFFSKAYMTASLRNLGDQELAKTLGFNARNQYAAAFMVKDYKTAARTFRKDQIERAISILKDYDLRSKGVNNGSTRHDELLQEMVFKLMH